MYRTVFFDLDGTLLNTIEDLAAAGNAVLSANNLSVLPVETFAELVGNGIYDLVRNILPAHLRQDDQVNKFVGYFYKYYQMHACDKTVPYPGVVNTVQKLKAMHITLGVLSNKPDELTRQIVEHFSPSIFSYVAGSTGREPAKPDPRLLKMMLTMADANPAQTLFCGDSPMDIQTARNAGILSCAVAWGYRSRDILILENPTYIVENTDALYALIVNS